MAHDYNTRGKERYGNSSIDDDPLANAKFEENITYHIDASERSLRDEFLNLKDIVIKRLQDENTRLSLEVIRRQSHWFRGELK